MVFSPFIRTVLLFVLALAATSVAMGIVLQRPDYPVTLSLLIAALILETALLIIFLMRIRKDLMRLVSALRNNDPSMQFSRTGRDPYFRAIHQGFNELIGDFRLVRIDRQIQQEFFEKTVDHIPVGLIAFNEREELRICNQAFMKMLEIPEPALLSDLDACAPQLRRILLESANGREGLHMLRIGNRRIHMIILSSGFILGAEDITLVSLRDITREIDRNEQEAWNSLLRVLRHEILNSLSPIRLIASRLGESIHPSEDNMELKEGLDTIKRRASELSEFLDAYSNLQQSPEYSPAPCRVDLLLGHIRDISLESAGESRCRIVLGPMPEDPVIGLDEGLIGQVVLNLVKNAIDALVGEEDAMVALSAVRERESFCISVRDNGPGIPEDEQQNIFIPFYSTKEGGSGIGLSFSRRVMQIHGGSLSLVSGKSGACEFQLFFPI